MAQMKLARRSTRRSNLATTMIRFLLLTEMARKDAEAVGLVRGVTAWIAERVGVPVPAGLRDPVDDTAAERALEAWDDFASRHQAEIEELRLRGGAGERMAALGPRVADELRSRVAGRPLVTAEYVRQVYAASRPNWGERDGGPGELSQRWERAYGTPALPSSAPAS